MFPRLNHEPQELSKGLQTKTQIWKKLAKCLMLGKGFYVISTTLVLPHKNEKSVKDLMEKRLIPLQSASVRKLNLLIK